MQPTPGKLYHYSGFDFAGFVLILEALPELCTIKFLTKSGRIKSVGVHYNDCPTFVFTPIEQWLAAGK